MSIGFFLQILMTIQATYSKFCRLWGIVVWDIELSSVFMKLYPHKWSHECKLYNINFLKYWLSFHSLVSFYYHYASHANLTNQCSFIAPNTHIPHLSPSQWWLDNSINYHWQLKFYLINIPIQDWLYKSITKVVLNYTTYLSRNDSHTVNHQNPCLYVNTKYVSLKKCWS